MIVMWCDRPLLESTLQYIWYQQKQSEDVQFQIRQIWHNWLSWKTQIKHVKEEKCTQNFSDRG